jgi:hypothetical protein
VANGRRREVNVDPKLGGKWKEKFALLGGQWKEKEKFPLFGGQWNVPLFGGQWNIPLFSGQWNVKEKSFSLLLTSPQQLTQTFNFLTLRFYFTMVLGHYSCLSFIILDL